MAADKFVVQEDATRTSADRISKETRRARREFNGTTKHFELDPRVIEELTKEGHLLFANDDLKGHLRHLEDLGYRYVTNREAYGERKDLNPDDRVKVRYGIADKENHPQDVYLMLQPWKFFNEDKENMSRANDLLDKQIRKGENDVEMSTGRTIEYTTHKK